MRKFLSVFCLLSASAFAGTWNGTVVDMMCKGKDLANHSKDCAIKCAKSGYGLVTSDGQFYKFDETGNSKALTALKSTKKDKDFRATVNGTMDGDVIKVESIMMQ